MKLDLPDTININIRTDCETTERRFTAILNSLSDIKSTLTSITLTLAKIDDFLTKPEIVFTPGKPQDKEL